MKVSVRNPRSSSLGLVVIALLVLSTLTVVTPATAFGQSAEVTFTKDVAPILQASCQTCHRDGAIAPMSLITYEDAAVGSRHQGQGVDTIDAALVYRQEYRCPGLQVRPVPER